MIAIIENKITRKPLVQAVKLTKAVAGAIKEQDFEKAMSFRDAEFAEYYRAYMTTTSTDQPGMKLPPEKVRRMVLLSSDPPGALRGPLRGALTSPVILSY
jgi:6-phosphofructokinase 1